MSSPHRRQLVAALRVEEQPVGVHDRNGRQSDLRRRDNERVPDPVGRGHTATVTTHVKNTSSNAAANIIVLCEINTADGNTNTSQYVTGLTFNPNQNRTLSFAFQLPVNLTPGTYSIDVGVFDGDWSTMYT
jgi:hypothetical protein